MLTWICHKMLMDNFLCTHALPHKETKVYKLSGTSWQISNQIHTLANVSLGTEFFLHELGEREKSNNVDPLNSVKEEYYCIYTKVPWWNYLCTFRNFDFGLLRCYAMWFSTYSCSCILN